MPYGNRAGRRAACLAVFGIIGLLNRAGANFEKSAV